MNTSGQLGPAMIGQRILPLLFIIALHSTIFSQVTNDDDITRVSDPQLIESLASKDIEVANAAIEEVLKRGERLIPLLIQKKGDQRFVLGRLTRSENASTIVFTPSTNSRRNSKLLREGKLITVEVAALYLITAIFYNDLYISQTPYLTDLSLAPEKRRSANTEEVVEKAWESTEAWFQKLEATGLEKLRKENEYPFRKGKVRFW